jgi:photosystem II stability/assembly factor-like uncharacterized protein
MNPRLDTRLASPRRWAGAALLAAAVAIAGCDGGVNSPLVIPALSRVVIAQAGDTTVVADTLNTGGNLQFTATAFDPNGFPVLGLPLAWSSSVPGVFGVSPSGLVTAIGEGQALLVVAVGDKRDTVTLMVLPSTAGWFAQVSNHSSRLNGVFFLPDGRRGWAAGDGGTILTTPDAGVTWSRQVSNSLFNLNAVWFTDANDGWAVGNSGAALHTLDGGTNWTPSSTNAFENLKDVVFATPDTGWAVGNAGAILRTFDGGATWTKQNPTTFVLNAVSFAGTRFGWAVGDNGTILGTVDRGLTWAIQPSVTAVSLRGVSRRSELLAWAVGQQGVAPRTIDVLGSPVWELRNTGASNILEAVHFPTDLTGFAVGLNATGLIGSTNDGGVTWATQLAPVSTTLRDVHFVDALRGWAVGDAGQILHTGTGGNP